MTKPRIAVVGTGANGAALSADMIRAGHDVTLIEQWPEHVEAMRRDGIIVEFPDETEVTPAEVLHLCQVAELRTKFDIVFTSVKSYDTRWVAELAKPVMREDSIFVGLQNGMTIDAVGEILGADRNVGAVLGIAANMYEPGRIVRQISREVTWFTLGLADGGVDDRVTAAADALRAAGRCETSDDIRASKWMKLIANIPEMLPSAILGLPLLGAVGVEGIRPVMDEAAREAYRLARQLGITMLPIFGKTAADVPDSDDYASDLLQAVLDHYSLPDTRVAVLQDWDKGRRAELDAFCGYIVTKQAEVGGEAPVNQAILRIAERIETGELTPGPHNADLIRSIPVA
ncbi:ketopantoate reductase family protein [Tessaracoccus sp. MC1756]|uniref:ketopantoate reductase family protein n=1 Tax=Tessaracoccus sp. MC1756 TaxID=2760311 RepID=UPI0016037792|nr:2-dehydropantoate 2-reductase N-terminal domain-containing protein [Tessaracoccus sp. MC1756]MBB1510928.1 NAD(P)-binding domain-containing protein [Tessaracoccus sp. MC1756]